jgi:regulator of protease activity HflC (stomatin/prohibitin superfamily)
MISSESRHSLVADFVWTPLVHIPEGYFGFLVQSGTSLPSVRLAAGWHWHWPGLTTIRLISPDIQTYTIGGIGQGASRFGDELVVAATKDLALLSLGGRLQLRVMPGAADQMLSQLSPRQIDRYIRPMVRQCLREVIGKRKKTDIRPSNELDKEISLILRQQVTDFCLELVSLTIDTIQPFSPLPQSPRQSKSEQGD